MKISKRPYDMTARAAKAEATKARIRAAAVRLYCEHAIADFTLEEVAARAGTTVQTVLRAFGGKDNLIFSALIEMAEGGLGLKPTPPGDVAAAVAAVYDVYETMGDFVISQLNDERRRPSLKPVLDLGRENQRTWAMTVFAPQLQASHGSARAQLLNMLLIATDVYVWKLLRRDRGVSRAAAEAIVRRMIISVTEGKRSHGTDALAELVGRREPAA